MVYTAGEIHFMALCRRYSRTSGPLFAAMAVFGGFTLLWLCANPSRQFRRLAGWFLIAMALGAAIELLQGLLSFLGRSMELMDAVADSVGAILGISLFWLLAYFTSPKKP